MKNYFGLIICNLFFLIAIAQQKTIDLQDCLEQALLNSHQVKSARLDVQKFEWEVKEKKSAGIPGVSVWSDYRYLFGLPVEQLPGEYFDRPEEVVAIPFGTNNAWETGLSFSQQLYNPAGKTGKEMIETSRDLKNLLTVKAEEDVLYLVAERYYELLKLQQQEKLIEVNKNRLKRLLGYVQLQYENDFAKATDVKQVEVKLAELAVKEKQLEQGIQTQYGALKMLVGWDMDDEILIYDSLPALGAGLEENGPTDGELIQLKLLDGQKQLEQQQIQMVKREALPVIEAKGRLYFQYQDNSFNPFGTDDWNTVAWLGLGLQLPLFEGAKHKAQVQQHQLEIEQIQMNAGQVSRFARFEYEKALSDRAGKQATLEQQKEYLGLLEELLEQTRLLARQGDASIRELIQAEADLQQARVLYSQGLFELKLIELKLLKSQGRIRNLLE